MKIHYVYYAIQKDGTPKVGATSKPENRCRIYNEFNILENYTCPLKCGDREIELQLQYFGKRDSHIHYAQTIKNALISWQNPNRKGKGTSNGNAKLSADNVRYIRKVYFKRVNHRTIVPAGMKTAKELSIKFNVDEATIRNVHFKRTYSSVK